MKNLKSATAKMGNYTFNKVLDTTASGIQLSQWKTINYIEEAANLMQKRLNGNLPADASMEVKSINMDLGPISGKGERLLIRAQFFAQNKNALQLKIFLHEQMKKGKACRIALAVYDINITRPAA